jgi:uroporphyrinogen-III decarboxylase
MGPVLEGFVRMGATALHPVEPPPMGDVTLADAKRRVGGQLCLVGNVQHHDLCRMPNDRFRKLVAETVRTGMEGGRYILSPTATPFGWPTMEPLEHANWLALLEVGLEVGVY